MSVTKPVSNADFIFSSSPSTGRPIPISEDDFSGGLGRIVPRKIGPERWAPRTINISSHTSDFDTSDFEFVGTISTNVAVEVFAGGYFGMTIGATNAIPTSPDVWSGTWPSANSAQKEDDRLIAKATDELTKQLNAIDMNDDESSSHLLDMLSRIAIWQGATGLSAVQNLLLDSRTSTELRSAILLAIARVDDIDTRDIRRNIVAKFLDSPSVATRYSAIDALGALRGERSMLLLSQQKQKEKNQSVLALINAHLR